MNDRQPTLFRRAALQHYIARRERAVLPHLVAPRTFAWLWIIFVLLIAAALLTLWVAMPGLLLIEILP